LSLVSGDLNVLAMDLMPGPRKLAVQLAALSSHFANEMLKYAGEESIDKEAMDTIIAGYSDRLLTLSMGGK
jgi:hypothetical protein